MGDKSHDDDPNTFDEMISDINFEKWLDAMKLEIDLIHWNQIQTLVNPPEGIICIGYKWIYKRKIGAHFKVEIYKARLVAKGYSQHKSIDYQKIFLFVTMLKSIRTPLTITTYYDYEI